MTLLQEFPGTLVESGQNFPEHLDLGSPVKKWQTIWIMLWSLCALFCSSLNWWRWVESLTGPIIGLAELHSVWNLSLYGPTSLEMQLKTGPKTCNAHTEKVQYQAFSSYSGCRFGDEWLHWDLQECSRSQELRLCWNQLIPSGLEYKPPVPHHQACSASKASEIFKWKPSNL